MMLCGVDAGRLLHVGRLRHHHPHDRRALAVAAGSHLDLLHLRHLHRRCGGDAAQRPSLPGRRRRRAAPAGRGSSIETSIRLVVISRRACSWPTSATSISCAASRSFRMPSMTPIASLYAAIPISGALIALFAFEQLVNGWRNGFEQPRPRIDLPRAPGEAQRHERRPPSSCIMTFAVPVLRLPGRAGRVLADRRRDRRRGLHRRHLRRDRAEDVRRRRFRGAARDSVLPAGRRADELGQRRAAGDQPVAGAGRPSQGRAVARSSRCSACSSPRCRARPPPTPP